MSKRLVCIHAHLDANDRLFDVPFGLGPKGVRIRSS
jgi:hypothetical protein